MKKTLMFFVCALLLLASSGAYAQSTNGANSASQAVQTVKSVKGLSGKALSDYVISLTDGQMLEYFKNLAPEDWAVVFQAMEMYASPTAEVNAIIVAQKAINDLKDEKGAEYTDQIMNSVNSYRLDLSVATTFGGYNLLYTARYDGAATNIYGYVATNMGVSSSTEDNATGSGSGGGSSIRDSDIDTVSQPGAKQE